MVKHVLLAGLLLATSLTTTAQTPGVEAFLGAGREMPTIEPQQAMPSLADVPPTTKGTLEMEVVVGRNGKVLHTRVVASPDPTGTFDGVSVVAVRSWKFRPAARWSNPISVLVRIDLEIQPASATDGPKVAVQLREMPAEPLAADPAILAAARPTGRPMINPTVIRMINPSYSEAAIRAKIQGIVELSIAVSQDGSVATAHVTTSLDKEHGLDRQALIAARHWLFQPATLNGEPVLSRAVLQLEFKLH